MKLSRKRLQTKIPSSSEKVWLQIWRNTEFNAIPLWDDLCELVYDLLTSLLHMDVRGKTILETGSGTGRISLRLAKEGAKVVLLDVSRGAVKFSKNLFKKHELRGDFIIADIFRLPFRNDTLDAVWSSGVLEHYTYEKNENALDESLRILIKGHPLIIIVPNRKAFVYNLFRKLDMRLGRWKFGYEEPLSLQQLYLFSSKPISYRSAGFFYQLHFLSLPILGAALNVWFGFLSHIFPVLTTIDKSLPGYLISGLWKK